jgi:copper transport protein
MGTPRAEARRWWRRWLICLSVMIMLGVASAGPANAHATLLFADPTINGAVATSPDVISLVFDEQLTPGAAPIHLADVQGRSLAVGPAQATQGGRVITVPVIARLADGVFSVAWQVTSEDGDTVGGAYRFVVGPATTLDVNASAGSSAQTESPALIAASVLRWMLFASLAMALGGLVGASLARAQTRGRGQVPSAWTGRSALAGLVSAAGLSVLIAGNGDLWRGVTAPSLAALSDSRPGRLTLLEVAAFGVTALLVALRRRRWVWIPLVGVVVAEGLRAHPEAVLAGWGAALTGLHLLAAAIWVGALVYIVRTALAWRSSPRRAWVLVAAYGRLAAWLFAGVVVTGIVTALLLVPLNAWTSTAYGRTLLVKLVLVAAVTALALKTRLRLRWERHSPRPRAAPGKAASVERALLVAVLAVSAVLVSLPPPTALGASAELPLPPPPVGLVVALGARAGQVGVSAAASTGQLVVHLSAPRLGNTAQNQDDPTQYGVGGTLSQAGQKDQKLRWWGCGPGCFVTAVGWVNGANDVALSVGAHGWAGGTVALIVPWPAQPGQAQLSRVVAAMAKVSSFTLAERVTSDSRTGPGQVHSWVISGAEFLASEPYGAGIAPQSALLGRHDGQGTLAVGFPGDLTQAQLVFDRRGRLLRETLTAPDHWITRTFGYPSG